MNFGFTEEQELLRKTARDFLAQHAASARVRRVLEGPETHSQELWRGMAELGWLGLALPEALGGAGLGPVELAIVAEELGRRLAPAPFLPTALAAAALLEAGDASQQAAWLPRIAAGECIATLAITEERGSEEPADLVASALRDGRGGFRIVGAKLFVPDAAAADLIVVVARTEPGSEEAERGLALFLVPRGTAGVRIEPLPSMDLLRPLYRVEFESAALPAEALLGGAGNAWPRIRRTLDRGLVMISAEMVGGAQECLDAAVSYAKERVQFGKPIGVNQAIKHKCADVLFRVESARALTYYAALMWAEGRDEAPLCAAMAKAWCSDAYRHAAAENLQIHGGAGFTWEFDCHLFLKRAKSDESWLGDGRQNRERVARLLRL